MVVGGDVTRTAFVTQFRNAGLTAAQALQFAATNANLVAIAGVKYADALARAAANAQRVGVSLDKTEQFADNLVGDFEGTISAPVKAAFDDDLAVPQVLAQISEALRRGNTAITDGTKDVIKAAATEIRGALAILGCDPFDGAFNTGGKDLSDALDGVIQLALAQRAAARDRKDFASSDAIRDGLAALGIAIEDTPQGQRWTFKG